MAEIPDGAPLAQAGRAQIAPVPSLGTKGQFMKKQYIVPPRCRATTFGS